MEQKIIMAEIEVQNCRAELFINGVPLELIDYKEDKQYTEPVMTNLFDGENTLEVIINPGSTPSVYKTEKRLLNAKDVSVKARLVRYPIDVYPGDPSGEVLITMAWKGEDKEQEFPVIISKSTDLGKQFGRWKWQDGEDLTLDEKTVAEVKEVIVKVHKAYGSGDPDSILALSKDNKLYDGSIAYPGESLASLVDGFREYLIELKNESSETGWRTLPLIEEEYDLRVVGNGKLIQCLDKNWKDIIKSKDETEFSRVRTYWMMLAKINGKWVIAR